MPLLQRKRPRRIANFRDLGGIVGHNGRRIRPGMLYRSGHIARLTEHDAQLLIKRYGIEAVVDLRSDSEQIEKPDVIIKGIEYLYALPCRIRRIPRSTRTTAACCSGRLWRLTAARAAFSRTLTAKW